MLDRTDTGQVGLLDGRVDVFQALQNRGTVLVMSVVVYQTVSWHDSRLRHRPRPKAHFDGQ